MDLVGKMSLLSPQYEGKHEIRGSCGLHGRSPEDTIEDWISRNANFSTGEGSVIFDGNRIYTVKTDMVRVNPSCPRHGEKFTYNISADIRISPPLEDKVPLFLFNMMRDLGYSQISAKK